MSTALPAPMRADQVLLQNVNALMQQLVAGLERLKRARTSSSALTSELARTSTTLQQLQQWLPTGSAAQTQLIKLHKLLPALLQTGEPTASLRLLSAVYQLQQGLHVSTPVELAAYRSVATAAALVPLVQLWRWQQESETDVFTLLQPLLLDLLQQLASTARKPMPVAAELGALLQRLQNLLQFFASATEQQAFSELLQTISLSVLQPQLFSPSQRMAAWYRLWDFCQRRRLPEHSPPACNDLELLQAAQVDLGRFRWQLQMFLQQAAARVDATPVQVPYAVMLLHYRLPWIFAAVEQNGLAQLCQLWHLCLLLHWQHRLPLSTTLFSCWRDMLTVMDISQWPALSAAEIARWHLQLLHQWPIVPARPVQRIAFQGVSESGDDGIPLAGIPEWLSRAFGLLTEQVRAAWFTDANSYAPHAAALKAELHLLEQGAAAIKLPVIESFCSLLLGLHQMAQHAALQENFPGALLWRAHQHLRNLLDEAAAWQEPAADTQLIADIKQWLQQTALRLPPAESVGDPAAAMVSRVKIFIESLAQSVEQPLRFSAEILKPLPLPQLSLCEAALIALLRFLVLEQVQNLPQRRQALKPVATTLVLILDSSEEGIAVEITEAGMETPPDAQTFKRLRHKLPSAVQRLYCRTQSGRGRSFRFVI